MERSFRKVVNANDRDVFLEMRRRHKDKEKNGGFLLLPSKNASDELDAAPIEYDKAIYRINGLVAPERRSRVDEFLNSENEKSEYDCFPLFELHGPGDLKVRLQKDLTRNHGVNGQIYF